MPFFYAKLLYSLSFGLQFFNIFNIASFDSFIHLKYYHPSLTRLKKLLFNLNFNTTASLLAAIFCFRKFVSVMVFGFQKTIRHLVVEMT